MPSFSASLGKKTKRTRRVVQSAPARILLSKKKPQNLPVNMIYKITSNLNPYNKARLALKSKIMYSILKRNLNAYGRLAGRKITRKGGPNYSLSLRGPPKEPPKKKQRQDR